MTFKRKGIILAGGNGTRLYPATLAMSKQLLPIYDKPMIYYHLSVLMLMGLQDIAVITRPEDQSAYRDLLGDGQQWGINLTYLSQSQPRGLADALIVAETFLAGAPCALILGDNIFYGHDLVETLRGANQHPEGATVFCYEVRDPQRYGVATFDESGAIRSIEEKPRTPVSNWAVTGLYLYDHNAPKIASTLNPSPRGELEITDLNNHYLQQGNLHIAKLGRGFAWLDMGTPDSMHEASEYVRSLERRQGLRIACVEEVAWRMGKINDEQLLKLAGSLKGSDYGNYLCGLVGYQ